MAASKPMTIAQLKRDLRLAIPTLTEFSIGKSLLGMTSREDSRAAAERLCRFLATEVGSYNHPAKDTPLWRLGRAMDGTRLRAVWDLHSPFQAILAMGDELTIIHGAPSVQEWIKQVCGEGA